MPRKDAYPYTWKDLEGQIAPVVLSAPRTGGDPLGEWPGIHARVIGYLVRNVVGKHWADHVTLIAAVHAAQRRDVATVEAIVRTLHVRFLSLFSLFKLSSMSQWNINQHFASYMRGEVPSKDPLSIRTQFFKRYMGATNLIRDWLDCLPDDQQEVYQPFLLPPINSFLAEEFAKMEKETERQQQDHRKEETEAVVPQFTA
jgi:hypothetical protein